MCTLASASALTRFAVFFYAMKTASLKKVVRLDKPATGQSVRFIRTAKRLTVQWWIFGEGVIKSRHVTTNEARRLWNKYRNAGFTQDILTPLNQN